MGIYLLPLPAIRTALILSSEAARYIIRVSPLMGAVTIGSASKSSFILRKALSASTVYWTIFPLVQLLSARIKGSVLSAPFERKRFGAANCLLRFCILLTDLGGCRSEIAFTFEGLAFIPCLVMRYPEKYSFFYAKRTFLWIEFWVDCLEPIKSFLDISEHFFLNITFYDYVVTFYSRTPLLLCRRLFFLCLSLLWEFGGIPCMHLKSILVDACGGLRLFAPSWVASGVL
ncbi:hypothetical protein Tco_0014666 [Tanacetum coccineum]